MHLTWSLIGFFFFVYIASDFHFPFPNSAFKHMVNPSQESPDWEKDIEDGFLWLLKEQKYIKKLYRPKLELHLCVLLVKERNVHYFSFQQGWADYLLSKYAGA